MEGLQGKLAYLWAEAILAISLLNAFWDDFPTLTALYAWITGLSLLLGAGCLAAKTGAAAWQRRGVSLKTQKKWARIQGVLFLVNAAVWPVGVLLGHFVSFDRDFVLMTQMLGLPVIGLLGVLPALAAKKRPQ